MAINSIYYLRLLLIIKLTVFVLLEVSGQTINKQLLIKPFQNNVFIQEKGQFTRTAKEMDKHFSVPVFYGIENAEFNAYFTANGIIFQYPERKKIRNKERERKEEEWEGKKEKEEKKIETIWHTATMQWINSNPSAELIPEEEATGYYNYDNPTNNDSTRYDFVPAYKKLKYVNLYPGVDIEFELPDEGGIKYKLTVQPNVIVPTISFQWDGLEEISTDAKGRLHLKSKFNSFDFKSKWHLMDHAPTAFSSLTHTNIPVRYTVAGNIVSFEFSSGAISSSEGIVIDPWITNTTFPDINRAFDIQEDSLGNVFIIGNHTNWQVQKYNSNGVLQWTYVTYAILMGDIAVDNPGNVYIIGGYSAGKRQKLDTAGVQLWSFAGLMEEWRLAFNYSKTVLAIGGYFINPGNNNLAKLDINSGAISNQIIYGEETRGIATDCNGDIYSIHVTFGYPGVAASNQLRKTNADFTPGGSMVNGFLLSEDQPPGTGYGLNPAYGSYIYQVLNALVVNGPSVFIYDGAALKKVNKTTLTIDTSISVPNGTVTMCGGVAADLCGNIYVGSTTGIEKFNSSLTHIQSISAPAAVYDLILNKDGDLLACGEGFLGRFNTNCTAPPTLIATLSSTPASCKGGTVSVTASGGTPPHSYLWEPGLQTTATVDSLTAGTYTCTVTDPFCHSYTDTITISQISALDLLLGDSLGSPGTIINETCLNSFDGAATIHASGGRVPYLYSWNTNPIQNGETATGLAAGVYLATVIDADSCWDTISVIITRNPDPVANFGSTKECQGAATVYSDSSSTSSGTISSWNWNFGDGTVSGFLQNPSHIYANAGIYSTTLIIQNNFGCADTISKSVKVYFNPVAGFNYADICFKDSVYFNNISIVDSSTAIAYYSWNFGDGAVSSSLQHPVHYYSTPGTYPVTLLVKTIDSCYTNITLSVNVFDPPLTAFSVNDVCLYDSAVFTNTSLDPSMGSIANWQWNFGDSTPLNTSTWSPNHLYSVPATYQISLITRSSNLACADTLIDSVTVFPIPVAGYSAADVCQNQLMLFNDTSEVPSGAVVSWSWDFGDNSGLSTLQQPNHSYSNHGIFPVSLIVTTDYGCKDTTSNNVLIHPLPTALFASQNVCLGNASLFTDLSTIPANAANDSIPSWLWNFGDNSPVSTTQSPSYTYPATGSYVVTLKTTSNFGCVDSTNKTIIINPNPQVNFTANNTVGCEPLCLSFIDGSVVIPLANAQWQWDLGNGSIINNSTTFDYCYIYDSVYAASPFAPDIYTITLTVTSDSGCVSVLTKNNYITVYPKPDAVFNVLPATTTITDPVINITNLSSGADSWLWNFGDGSPPLTTGIDSSSVSAPLSHTYTDTGSYTIMLITSTQYGCIDTAYETVIIEPDFMFYIPNSFSPNDDGINDTFIGRGSFIKEFEMSIFDRWGNMVYRTDDIDKPWDGKSNYGNEPSQTDIYVYSIKIIDFKMKKHTYKGTVTLMR